MMILTLFLCILLTNFTTAKSIKNMEFDVIKDILESYDEPTFVCSKLNWEKTRLIRLAKVIFKLKKPIRLTLGSNCKVHETMPSNHVLFIVDVTNNNSWNVLKEADVQQQFRRSYRWLILETQGKGYESILSGMDQLNILIDSNVLLATRMDNSTYDLLKIYKISNESGWITENFGSWTSEQGLVKSEIIKSNALRRRNLRGHSVRNSIVITDNRTKTELEDSQNYMIDSIPKAGYRHTKNLCQFMNATHTVVFNAIWGFKANGTWHGMFGDLARGVADLGGTVSFPSIQRLEIVDYIAFPTPVTSKFVFREPPLSYQNNLFILPFKASVWYCLAVFVVFIIIILYIHARWEIKKFEFEDTDINEINLQPNLCDITVLVISAIAQQGCFNELKGALGRLVFFILFLSFLFLYTSYSANIVALLQSSSKDIQTLKDLLDSKLELGVEDKPYTRYHFSVASEPVRKAIYETKIAPKGSKPNFLHIEDGVKKLQKTPFAFCMNVGTGYKVVDRYFKESEKCGLKEIYYFESSLPWQCCKKNSPFRELYKIGLYRIKEHGITDRENRILFGRKPNCIAQGGSFVSVNMTDVYPVFLMLLYGILIAILFLFYEIVIHKYVKDSWITLCKKRRRNNN